MIISDAKKFLFIHIPKTGGSSLTWMLRYYVNNIHGININELETKKGWQGLFHINGQHSSYQDNSEIIQQKQGYFKFAFVRNPWDLAFSWYLALSRESTKEISPKNFKSFLFEVPQSHRTLIDRSQFSYICDHKGQVRMDYLAYFENYQEVIPHLMGRFGISEFENCKLNVANNNNLHYRDFFDDDGKNLIAEKYRIDIETFRYEF